MLNARTLRIIGKAVLDIADAMDDTGEELVLGNGDCGTGLVEGKKMVEVDGTVVPPVTETQVPPPPAVAETQVPPPPAVAETAIPANTLSTPGLDADGLPWDARIHSSGKSTMKNGKWTRKRGVTPEEVASVEAELRGAVVPEATVPPVAESAAPPPPTPQPQVTTVQPGEPITLIELMDYVLKSAFTAEETEQVCTAAGVEPGLGLRGLGIKPELLPVVHAGFKALRSA